jgi:acyl transferase domain-containing protein
MKWVTLRLTARVQALGDPIEVEALTEIYGKLEA